MSDQTSLSSPGAKAVTLESRQVQELTTAQAEHCRGIERENDLEGMRADYPEVEKGMERAAEAPFEHHGEVQKLGYQKGTGVADSMQVCRLEFELEKVQEQLEYQITQNNTLAEENATLAGEKATLAAQRTGLESSLVEEKSRNLTLQGQLTDMSTRYERLEQLLVKFQRSIHAELSQNDIERNDNVGQPSKVAPLTSALGLVSSTPASEPAPLRVSSGQFPSSAAPFTPEAARRSIWGTRSESRAAHTNPATPVKMPESSEGPYTYPSLDKIDVRTIPLYYDAVVQAQLFGTRPPPPPAPKAAPAGPPATATPE